MMLRGAGKPCHIVIFGPYKSGTTGVFYKIRNSLPGVVRTLFEETVFVPEKGDTKRWVLAKTILGAGSETGEANYGGFLTFEKKIYLCRDPRDLVISGILFMIQQEPSLYENDRKLLRILDILREKETDPQSISMWRIFEAIVDESEHHSFEQVTEWLRVQYEWLVAFEKKLDGYCLLKYEDFVDEELETLESYLGFPLKGEALVDPVHDHVPRTRTYNNWIHWFTEEDISFFRPIFVGYIKRYGYSRDWRLSENQSISPEHCSRYILRTVNKKRAKPIEMPAPQ